MPALTTNLMTAEMLIEQYPAIRLRTLKHWLQVDPDDFRARCVVKVGKLIFYDLEAFDLWLLEHKEPGLKGED